MRWAILILLLSGCAGRTSWPTSDTPVSPVVESEARLMASFLKRMGYVDHYTSVAGTGSMRPLVDEGNILLYRALPYEKLTVGMIPLVKRRDGSLLLHCIYEPFGEDQWVTMGYNNTIIDPLVLTRDNYYGYVLIGPIWSIP